MADRPKRVIQKPHRYETTSSSEEAPKRTRIALRGQETGHDMQDDINELRTILQENTDNANNETFIQTAQTYSLDRRTHTNTAHTYTTDSYTTHTYTNTPTYTELHTYQTEPNTVIATSDAYRHTHPSIHTDIPQNTLTNSISSNEFQNISPVIHQERSCSHIHLQGDMHRQNSWNQHTQRAEGNETQYYQLRRDLDVKVSRIHERLDRMEAEMKKSNNLLQKMYKCLDERKNNTTQKPARLPISSLQQMDDFEICDEDTYSGVVTYLRYIGGFNLKEAVNLCLKESILDSITPLFTWLGREENQRALYNARLTMAIYEAVCDNQHFNKPTRSEFQAQMREALRASKERLRHKLRKSRMQEADASNHRRNFWSDQQPETADEEEARDNLN